MKGKKIFCTMLSLCMFMGVLAGCAEEPASKSHKKDIDDREEEIEDETNPTRAPKDTKSTEDVTETTLETTEETTIETTIEATEVTEETTEIILNDSGKRNVPFTSDSENCYNILRQKADELHTEDYGDNLRYCFYESYTLDGDSNWHLSVMSIVDDDLEMSFYVKNGVVVEEEIPSYVQPACFDFETFMSLPCLVDYYNFSSEGKASTVEIVTDIDDGVYYGNILLVNDDGTKALADIGLPYTISAEEYAIYEVDPDAYFESVPELQDCYGWFVEEDGVYILTGDSDCKIVFDSFLAWIDISSDVVEEDSFSLLLFYDSGEIDYDNYQESDYVYNYDGNALVNSSFMEYNINYQYGCYFSNGWLSAFGLLEPVQIVNNEATNLNIGWR